jgi:MFS family permease
MTGTITERPGSAVPPPQRSSWLSGLWRRQLAHYPDNGPRAAYLAIVVLATVVLYYELYIPGAVATQIIAQYDMTLRYFIIISVVGNLVGALGSLAAGLADRWGRANLVAYGLAVTAVLVLLLPHASSKGLYLVLFVLVSLVEGVILVATPALIRDFSPQLGRAAAMGFWTLGPVLGSLVVTEVSSHTLASHPRWQFQFTLCGVIGLIVFAIALVGLRELSPQLRDQLMVSAHDRALIEARAAGIDPETAGKGAWGQMLKLDVVGSAFAISVFLLFYYIAVGFFVIYFATTFGYTPARANGLANWYWISNAIALVVTGLLSDRIRVRKPFMLLGALVSAAGVAVFAVLATHPKTGYYTFAWLLVVIAASGGMAYCAWMASFTETVERHNPAATATGLAVWGGLLRTVVTLSLLGFMLVVSASSVLVDKGTKVQELATQHASELATIAKVQPAVLATLGKNPTDPVAGAQAVSQISGVPVADVARTSALSTKYAPQLQTIGALEPQTLSALGANPGDTAAQTAAVGQISSKLKVGVPEAITRLKAVAAVPPADLGFLQATGPKVQKAVDDLKAVSSVPKADLAYLQANGAQVQKAAVDSPKQWQTWWWVCFAGQIVFLPFIFVMAGRWSPKRAKQDADEHEQLVAEEMRRLGVA